jgi:helicase
MGFRGLFVGIDRYSSPHINWLSCAVRDARALHALFSDTLGTGACLLADGEATKASIEKEMEELAQCSEDDVVVLSFSGHGSQLHQLVPYDTDVLRLADTTISLDRLAEYFSRIPARRLVCFLDCCFSGGMGAKVLRIDIAPRDMSSAEAALQRLSGEGRVIFTASTATQPAWENQRFGHGLLTWFLLEALCGAPEVVEGEKIPVLSLLQHVSQRVTSEAAKLGKPQSPTIRGQLDGGLAWPVFQRGTLYQAAFPERMKPLVTSEIASLATYGFPSGLLQAWSASIPGLNALQVQAINEYRLLDGEHLVVSAPTSSGKTMIGELAGLKGTLERKRTLFLLPLRALVNDKHQYFQKTYGQFGIRTIRATGEITDDIPDLMRSRFDICLMTYEKFAAMILGNPYILEQVGTVVIDEVQMITDANRGLNLEFILTILRTRRDAGVAPQIIALSAVIGDTCGFERWLGARLLRSDHRPVPLQEGVVSTSGGFRYFDSDGTEKTEDSYIQPRYGKGSSQDYIIPLVRKLVSEGKQVIVFRETRGEARGCALYLAKALGLPAAKEALALLPVGDPSSASNALRQTLAGGVAFHNADLDRDERLAIEQEFRRLNSSLKVITATTTLAMGVNTPAEAVIIAGLEHPGETPTPYTVAEYKNMVGRAGRLGFATKGLSFLISTSPAEEHQLWDNYVRGKPENLISHFVSQDTDIRSLILRILASAQRTAKNGLTREELINFLHGSFGAFLQRDLNANWKWDQQNTEAALLDLISNGLVSQDVDNRLSLTAIGRLSGESGVEVESIIRLVRVLQHLPADRINDPTLITAAQLTVELDGVLFPINKKSTQKEPQQWTSQLQRQQVASSVMGALGNWTSELYEETLRAKKAVACLYWISDTSMEDIEKSLTQFGGAFDGAAGPVRAVSTRTSDLIDTVVRVAELTHESLDLAERRVKLITRLQVGVSNKNVDLARLLGNNITRGDYRRLSQARLDTPELVSAASDEQLRTAFGGSTEAERKVKIIRNIFAEKAQGGNADQKIVPLPLYEG